MSRRDLEGLRRPPEVDVAPPPRPAAQPAVGPAGGGATSSTPAVRPPREAARQQMGEQPKAKTVHSVPVEVIEELKRVAISSGRSYTQLVLQCVVACRDQLLAERGQAEAADPLERGAQRHRGRERRRVAQLSLYLTAAERAALDELAERVGMPRSGLVTAALERALPEVGA